MEVQTLVSSIILHFRKNVRLPDSLLTHLGDRGCVTPQILHNWKETCGMDMELVDGYEEIPDDAQKKVKRALEQEHVDDDEWNGVSVVSDRVSLPRL